jgi:hypothetical protein
MIRLAENTAFGRKHGFRQIKHYDEFVRRVPVMDYDGLYPYIERILNGEKDVLWPGMPIALASTSGTSTGPIKYIPVTEASAPAYRKTSRNSVLAYVARTGKTQLLAGKMFFMSQNPEYQRISGMPVAPISGVSVARVPKIFRKGLLPSANVARIGNWEKKLDAMLDEAMAQDLTLISGIPPWLLLFFEHIVCRTGKKVGDVFPHLKLIVHGGVNVIPYRSAMEDYIGRPVDFIETYAATEGFIAFQDEREGSGMLVNMADGTFFEFIPENELGMQDPTRIPLEDVDIGLNYAVILTTTAGLWAYDIGDTVKFVSKNPHRLVVTGRTRHYISAFGEHVISEEVDEALAETLAMMDVSVKEFTVAPCLRPSQGGLPRHEWFIEFDLSPEDLGRFSMLLDERMREKNIIYNGLVEQKIIGPLKVNPVRRHGFKAYMDSIGKIGGQNKVPRLMNHRKVADAMETYIDIPENGIGATPVYPDQCR